MSLCDIGTRTVVTADPGATVAHLARLMRNWSIGCVVIVRETRPVGVVTDRDLVIRVLARSDERAPALAEEVMSRPLVALPETASPEDAFATMREHEIRRLPLLAADASLAGILCFDDLIGSQRLPRQDLADLVQTHLRTVERQLIR